MKQLLGVSVVLVSDLTSDLTLGAGFGGLLWLAFGSFFTLGSALTLAFCGTAILEGELTDCFGVPEDFKAESERLYVSFCVVFLVLGVTDGLRVDVGPDTALPLAGDEVVARLHETALFFVPVRFAPPES